MAEKIIPTHSTKKCRIAIIGPGGVGGFLAAVLNAAGHTIITVARAERILELKKNGIILESNVFGRLHERVQAESHVGGNVDFIFITTKAYSLDQALLCISKDSLREDTLIIPLLNGIDHYDILHKAFPQNAVSGTISIEAFKKSHGIIHHTSSFARLTFAADLEKLKPKIRKIASVLMDAGLECTVAESEKEILWKKLVRLTAVSLSTAATHLPIGTVRTDKMWRERLLAIITEACLVARLDGVTIESTLQEIDHLEPHQLSSLERDVREGNPTELEHIAGAIVRRAELANLEVPTIKMVMDEIRRQGRRTLA